MSPCEPEPQATPTDRLAWLEGAIAETRGFCEWIEATAAEELRFTRFDSWDYDFELDLNAQAKMARGTLGLLEQERSSILARNKMRAERAAREARG